MSNEAIMAILLLVGVFLGMFAGVLINDIIYHVKNIIEINKNNKRFKEKEKAVAAMKAAGEFHEWVEIPHGAGTMLVCKKTGWCPTLQGFIPVKNIESYLDGIKAEEEYKSFRAARIQLIAHEFNMTIPNVENIVEKVFTMKKDFYLLRIERLQRELKEKATVTDGTKEN